MYVYEYKAVSKKGLGFNPPPKKKKLVRVILCDYRYL